MIMVDLILFNDLCDLADTYSPCYNIQVDDNNNIIGDTFVGLNLNFNYHIAEYSNLVINLLHDNGIEKFEISYFYDNGIELQQVADIDSANYLTIHIDKSVLNQDVIKIILN